MSITRWFDLRQLRCWMRTSSQYLVKATLGVVEISFTVGLVVLILGGILRIEAGIMGEPWQTWQERIDSLEKSRVLGAVESISIITALVLFVQKGHQEEKNRAHYMAWIVLDLAHGRETSYARIQVLEELNKDGVSLKRLDAPDADLFRIDLKGADLEESTLKGTKLVEADLQGAKLEFANLQNADLQQAILRDTGLLDANLQHANLGGADLSNADLRSADLQQANLLFTNLMGADFRGAKNLNSEQVRRARNWALATYDEEFRRELGLLPASIERS